MRKDATYPFHSPNVVSCWFSFPWFLFRLNTSRRRIKGKRHKFVQVQVMFRPRVRAYLWCFNLEQTLHWVVGLASYNLTGTLHWAPLYTNQTERETFWNLLKRDTFGKFPSLAPNWVTASCLSSSQVQSTCAPDIEHLLYIQSSMAFTEESHFG